MSEQSVSAVLAEVAELLPTLRDRAQETEDARRVPAESIKALQKSGFFRLLQPVRYGGLEADPVEFYTAVKMLASACGSTGWVASILGIHPWNIALFDDRAQQEVWGEDQDTLVSSSYAPMGKSEIVEGGYRLSGKWSFSSGCDHATWALLGGPAFQDGKPVDFLTYLVPISDYRVNDVWRTVGLRGTGSNDIVVEDVFVPAHRALSFQLVSKCKGPGQEVNTSPLYKLPFGSVHPSTITAPIIGMAQGAYDAHVEHQRGRVRAAYAGENAKEDPFAKVRVAEAGSEIDAAWLQLTSNIAAEYALVKAGEKIPFNLRLKVRRDQVRGTERAIFAVDRMFENSGGRALAEGTPIQRFWRDAHAGRVHAANDPERAYKMFGTGEFGEPVMDGMV
ncbi:Acyl-CoA dehydrogenase type 2 domain protein OS=Tsukamurella paurometabola (strain ATCC 8368 / DSM / CCUG 35730 / CIP 100753 / JCM 10117 / KCTC 9821 / NBRC 16120 / NCIMB 702349 / NCTC 13040) OX=521096 GN=Tpau_3845 PE=4 SV=1 [Tsukamurella paurometabola]|uniref:Flavin-dependent monooxygenase, oxygenase subunit HsaA n=1 Tax=Tsukamurella paurometabola (strain ATCC 8368 / DSM 20162 / CCUG 35730 / CIP 100753 / JCM 10117 / KCTC 9821 / NBRC 16120 / NCIMB 702349 / NCTC 13040) TaxID=521096 RepID=D5UME6_TSUPD|nr:3-hydroxy-9,10-secoandrosta-1,3,5(10)-triene-9,17-dione monooxygenase oxygenase subunit [Tsukamurella paurometabola]ADG80420.1 Acyl-CoA dehydrogenase type 2 domain protein [Tsukamurella paurometabola DSM 20162]SUP39572.1 Flavin-dependent monooxygenase, oxygenase subunit HsaA [Tsukamurella paurometabola]